MLLLIADLEDQFRDEIPKAEQAYLLDDLFDIKLGMIEDRYHPYTSEGSEKVGFLSISSFEDVDGKDAQEDETDEQQFNQIDEVKVKRSLEKQKEKKVTQNPKKQAVPLSYISENRLLQRNDYLISMRGFPTGFSLYNTKLINSGQYRLVASNHFVQLRPRTPEDVYVPYLHLLLDLLVQHHLLPSFKVKLEELKASGTTGYGVINPFSVRELRQMKLHLPKNKYIQKEIHDKYSERFKHYLKQVIFFKEYQSTMFKNLNIIP